MKVLLDECLPRKLKRSIEVHDVRTVPEAGWAGKKNGELLRLAEQAYDVLVTNDQNIEHQQDLERFEIALIVLIAPTNDIVDLLPLVPAMNTALKVIRAREVRYIR